MAGGLRPRRRLAAGAKATLKSKGNGQYVYNADEFRYSGTFFRITNRSAAAQPVHDRGEAPRDRQAAGAKDQAYKPVWTFAPDAPLEARPYGGTITVTYPVQHDHATRYDRTTNTYLRSVTGEKKQTDAATGNRVAPKNVVVMRMQFGPLNDGHPARIGSRPTSSAAARPGSRPTAGRSRAPGRRPR